MAISGKIGTVPTKALETNYINNELVRKNLAYNVAVTCQEELDPLTDELKSTTYLDPGYLQLAHKHSFNCGQDIPDFTPRHARLRSMPCPPSSDDRSLHEQARTGKMVRYMLPDSARYYVPGYQKQMRRSEEHVYSDSCHSGGLKWDHTFAEYSKDSTIPHPGNDSCDSNGSFFWEQKWDDKWPIEEPDRPNQPFLAQTSSPSGTPPTARQRQPKLIVDNTQQLSPVESKNEAGTSRNHRRGFLSSLRLLKLHWKSLAAFSIIGPQAG